MIAFYDILVEGSLYETVKSRRMAMHYYDTFQKEGWNVKVVAYYETVFGLLGREIFL